MQSHQLVMKLVLLLLIALLAHLSCGAQAQTTLLNAASVAAMKRFLNTCCQGAPSFACQVLQRAVDPARSASEDLCAVLPKWCDAQGNQVAIVLGDPNQLTCKTFPTNELSAMRFLEGIDLSKQGLAGDLRDVAAMFDRLPNLKEFAASSNRLTGSLTCQLIKPNMRTMMLTDNSISGQLPGCFLSSRTMLFLWLTKNKLSGPLPNPAPGIPLEELRLGSNSFSGPVPPGFASLTKLKVLQLDGNQLTGPIPKLPKVKGPVAPAGSKGRRMLS